MSNESPTRSSKLARWRRLLSRVRRRSGKSLAYLSIFSISVTNSLPPSSSAGTGGVAGSVVSFRAIDKA
ncbi:hypothetical protein D9M73_220280 [compost metagenome]